MDNSLVVSYREVKSISSEETLPSDTGDFSILEERLISHANKVAWRLRQEGLKGRTITLKIKLDDFTEMSKGLTIRYSTDSTKIISDSAIKQLKDYPLKRKVRLIGVAVSNLEGSKEGSQTSLFMAGGEKERERRTDKAMDEIRERFGGKVIKRGRV